MAMTERPTTYEEGKALAKRVTDMVNAMNNDEAWKGFVEGIAYEHPTLQQNVMRELIYPILKLWASFGYKGMSDMRNENTHRMAERMIEKTEDISLPFV